MPRKPGTSRGPAAAHYESERLRLAARLRFLRTRAGITGVELAARVGMGQSKLSRVETGTVTPSIKDVRALASALDLDEAERDELITHALTLLSEFTSNRLLNAQKLDRVQLQMESVEAAAILVRLFEPTVIPGLLQVAGYAASVFRKLGRTDEADIADGVAARTARQTVLYNERTSFRFLMTEAAARMPVASHEVMRAQWDRIISVMSLPNVDVGIILIDKSPSIVHPNGFCIFDDELVEVEMLTADVNVRDERDIRAYAEAFEALSADAMHGDEAREFLAALINRPGRRRA